MLNIEYFNLKSHVAENLLCNYLFNELIYALMYEAKAGKCIEIPEMNKV